MGYLTRNEGHARNIHFQKDRCEVFYSSSIGEGFYPATV